MYLDLIGQILEYANRDDFSFPISKKRLFQLFKIFVTIQSLFFVITASTNFDYFITARIIV